MAFLLVELVEQKDAGAAPVTVRAGSWKARPSGQPLQNRRSPETTTGIARSWKGPSAEFRSYKANSCGGLRNPEFLGLNKRVKYLKS